MITPGEEFQVLRREIEIRILRETIYKAVEALNTKKSLAKEIARNDEHIKLIGRYLLSMGNNWEKFYAENTPKPA